MTSATAQPASAASVSNEVSVPWRDVERFLGQLAHDLRNGLNACELQLTFLGEIVTDPDAVQEVKGLRTTLGGITKQLQALRMATGAVTAHSLDYPAGDLFEDLRERFARLHPTLAGRVAWKATTDQDLLVTIDPELVLSSCLELLSNALQFAPAGSSVVAELGGSEDGKVRFTVKQPAPEPPVTPPDDWGRVPMQSTRRGAYGLGLFRVRRALAAQEASLEFRHDRGSHTLLTTVLLPAPSSSSAL